MKRPITISLSPNTESDDVSLAWKILFKPWLWRNQNIVDEVESHLSRYLDDRSVVTVSSGRVALHDVLKVYGVSEGDEVIIQAFTCISVPAAVMWTKATPVFADIQENSYNLNPTNIVDKITANTKAIIIQHTFGMPADVDQIISVAKQHDLIVIEDCAHALGATYKERRVGTLADAAILSFGRDKTLSSVFGGAVVSQDQKIIDSVKKMQSARQYPSFFWVVQQLLHPILFSLIVPTYFRASLGKFLLVLFQKTHLLSRAVSKVEKKSERPPFIEYKYSPALAYLLERQLQKLDRFTKRRQFIAEQYYSKLDKQKYDLPRPQAGSNWLRFPVMLKSSSPKAILDKAKSKNILLGDWYNKPVTPCEISLPELNYKPGTAPVAERLSKQTINLPTYPLLTDDQVEEVISFMNSHE